MLNKNGQLDIEFILQDLDKYEPKRRGWVWRTPQPNLQLEDFTFADMSTPLKKSVALPSAKYFNNIDPQGTSTITTEIASGRFEDDIRRMMMAAYHGADHIMVIRTAGQSHFDGLIEGSPQGIGGIPITRKQLRAQRKALDFIEDEVGRPINYHSYVSGVAGPDIAVLFVEEGVNGAHQDPQYNVLYRNINMLRSFVDAAESKKIMAHGGICQIDGAHNANATARKAWLVMPELMVQHAINSLFSKMVGMDPELISLSTVPPTAPPAPNVKLDLPYAIALRDFFSEYKMRAQMNTKYMESSTREATVTHVLNLLISKLTSADIQSTITPDEGRNVPWHVYNIEALDTAKQVFAGLDDLMSLVDIKTDGPLVDKIRELKERAVLFLEEIINQGGYFKAVEAGLFVDSAQFPDRHDDGIKRQIDGGVGAGHIYKRDADYMAPVTAHYGYNNIEQYGVTNPAELIGGCTFEDRSKIVYIDEISNDEDNVATRLEQTKHLRNSNLIKPEVEWLGDGYITVDLFLPTYAKAARVAALEIGAKMNLEDVEVIHVEIMHPTEGTRIQIKGRFNQVIDLDQLKIPEDTFVYSEQQLFDAIAKRPIKVVAATVGQDEHSVGIREILDIKHGGIEKFGIKYNYLGTSVPLEKLIDVAIESNADAILASTIISHDETHYKNMKKLHELAIEKGVRDNLLIICGGTQVDNEAAKATGIDAGFGRGTKGIEVASFLVDKLAINNEK